MTLHVPCRALLFDADGVLVDSDAIVEASWARWARRWGLEPDEVIATIHGRRSADSVPLLIAPEHRAEANADIDRSEIEDAGGVTACPGARELLASLPAGSWAVVTSGTLALASARFAAAGLPAPAVWVTADDVPAGKPDPTGYRMAARALGVPVGECLVLEDSHAGLAAGRAAGAGLLGVSERALGGGAPHVVRDLAGCAWVGDGLALQRDALLG